jgi:hypothetical protein
MLGLPNQGVVCLRKVSMRSTVLYYPRLAVSAPKVLSSTHFQFILSTVSKTVSQ